MKAKDIPILSVISLKNNPYKPNVRFTTASGRITAVTPKSIKHTPATERKWARWFILECYEEAKYINDEWNLIFLEYAAKKIEENIKWRWTPSDDHLYQDYLTRTK